PTRGGPVSMRWPMGRTAAAGLALALGVLLVNAWVAFWNTHRLVQNERAVDHTRKVLVQLESLLAAATDAETGQRGYLLSGDPAYLRPYEAAGGRIDEQFDQLQALTADNPAQQARV